MTKELGYEEQLSNSSQELNPLGPDIAHTLPRLNNASDRTQLLQYSLRLTETVAFPTSLPEAQALQRDVGFLAASLTTHGYDINEIPNLKNPLLASSEITGEVPRDTVYSYAVRNPRGSNMRTFTGTDEERTFIEATRNGAIHTEAAARELACAQILGCESPDFEAHLTRGALAMSQLVEGILSVRKSISPDFFTNKLRPYFPPMEIDSVTYYAPGGAQLPVLLVDQVLWGADVDNQTYKTYLQDNLKYLPPSLVKLSDEVQEKQSIVTQISSSNITRPNAIEATARLLNTTLQFRYPHLRIAESNMAIRDKESLGSGGYDLEVLQTLISQTQTAKQKLTNEN